MVTYGRLKARETLKRFAPKVAWVSYERWSLTAGSKHSDLTWELWVFWKTGPGGEVVAYEKW